MGYRDELGIAVRITTIGTTPYVIRAAWPSTAIDNGLAEFYEPDLLELSDMASAIASPTSPVAPSSAGIVIANRGGAFNDAVNDGVNFDNARIEVWRTRNDEFDSVEDSVIWAGEFDELALGIDDEKMDATAQGPLKALEGYKYPNRYVTGVDAPQANLGKLIPIRFGFWGDSNRYSELLCTNRETGEVTVYDSHAANGGYIRCIAVNASPTGGRPDRDSLVWIVSRSEFNAQYPIRMMSYGPGAPRQTIANNDCINQDVNTATFEIRNRVVIFLPPIDSPFPTYQVDPCQTVSEDPNPGGETVEQCPATDPTAPKDSWGAIRALRFNPENDVVLARHNGPIGVNPDGVTYSNNVSSFGGICDTILRRQIGLPTSKLKIESFLSPSEWPGHGTQTDLTFRNSPQLDESYDLPTLLGTGAFENRAILYEESGKIAMRRLRLPGASVVSYAIEPRVIAADGVPQVVKGRWGEFANAITHTAYGHGIAPDLLPFTSVYLENATSIAERRAAGLIERVPYVVGQESGRSHGLWLDGVSKDQFTISASDILALLSARHQVIEVTIVPPLEDVDTVMGLKIGDLVSLTWPSYDDSLGVPRARQPLIPEDSPASCLVIGLNPDQLNAVLTVRLLRYLGAGGSTRTTCSDTKYTDPDAAFPEDLGGDPLAPWDDGWSADQQEYAICNAGYYGISTYGPA